MLQQQKQAPQVLLCCGCSAPFLLLQPRGCVCYLCCGAHFCYLLCARVRAFCFAVGVRARFFCFAVGALFFVGVAKKTKRMAHLQQKRPTSKEQALMPAGPLIIAIVPTVRSMTENSLVSAFLNREPSRIRMEEKGSQSTQPPKHIQTLSPNLGPFKNNA